MLPDIMEDYSCKGTESTSIARLRLAALVTTLSSFVWGYSISVLNVCIVENAAGSLLIDINLNDNEKQLATALVLIGAWVGALLTDFPAERFGRKPVLLFTNALFLAGTLACALAVSKPALFAGRSLLGLACGAVTGVVPTLLTEISPAHARGQITTLHQLQLTLGILFSGLVGYLCVTTVPSGWRYVHGFLLLPVLLQCLLWSCVPESPRWLARERRGAEARNVLLQLRAGVPVPLIEAEVDDMLQQATAGSNPAWRDVFTYRRPMALGSLLVFFQAMTGINSVIFYSARIFAFAGVENAIAASSSVGVVNVLMTILSVGLVDSYGRRILLLVGTSFMTVSLATLSLVLLFLNAQPKLQGLVAVASTLLFVSGFAVGFGAVVWVILGEILPSSVRSKAMGFFMGISYLCNILIATCTLTLINALGSGPTQKEIEKNGIAKLYLIFGIISAISLVFIKLHVRETKGSQLDRSFQPVDVQAEDEKLLLNPTADVDV